MVTASTSVNAIPPPAILQHERYRDGGRRDVASLEQGSSRRKDHHAERPPRLGLGIVAIGI